MLGGLIIAVVLFVVIPVGVLMTCAAIAAGLGWALRADVEQSHEGSELIDINV